MSKIAVMTDSDSGITQAAGNELGITVIPMPFYINEKMFKEDIDMTQMEFFDVLNPETDVKTSQPLPGDVIDAWDKALDEDGYEEIVHVPMSAYLSGGYQTAMGLAEEEKYAGRVHVVNSQRVSITQRQMCLDARLLAEKGFSGKRIKEILEEVRLNQSIYLAVDTLKFLKKGGRVTAAGAAIGTVLNIKPVLQIMGEKIDAYSKNRGWKAAKKSMFKAMDFDMSKEGKFGGRPVHLCFAHSCPDDAFAREWKETLEAHYGQPVHMDRLSLNVVCHTGPGAISLAASEALDIDSYTK